MKKLKKVLASVFAFALAFSGLAAMPVQAGQDASALEDGTAYLNINKSDWSDFDAEYTNTTITGDGSYTVSMTAAEPVDMGEFNALEVVNGETVLGTGCVITVDSIKINGEEAALQGASYTCSADGGGVTTRVNLYNEYNAPDDTATAGDDKHADQRVAEGSVMDATATLIDKDARAGVSTLEVAFTVSGFGTQGGAAAAGETPTAEGPAMAHLNINKGDWSAFEAEYVDAEITGDGTYTVSMTAAEALDMGEFNALEIENGELLLGTAYTITIDSIKLNGEEAELQGSSYTCSADGGGVTTRVNLYNEYNSPDDAATAGDDNHLDQRVAEGSVMDATAKLIAAEARTGVTTIEVTFTVAGVGSAAEAGEEPAATEVPSLDLNGEYHAYFGLQTPTYSFRNAFDDETYGRETEYFNQITGWDSENNAVVRPGTFTDAVIAGNGTYTVSVEGMDLSGDFDSQDYFNLLFLSTDIPNTGEITISDIKLDIDGRDVTIAPILSPDSVNYINMLVQNIWNDNVKEIGYYQVPPTAMKMTFTVSGFAYDNASASAEEPAAPETPDAAPADTPAPAENSGSEGGVSPVVIVVIVVVVIAVIAVVAVVLSKKKKSDK
ncbi:MAG: hypothetical protein NC517_00525 [Firmicutes bacterium]|nr:hypothetical protein [Bacillota bacterium]